MRGAAILTIWMTVSFMTCTPVYATQEREERNGSEKELQEYYTKEEVNKIIDELTEAALTEIELTALEAGKEGASEWAGKAFYYERLSRDLEEKNILLEGKIKKLEKRFYAATGALSILAIFALSGLF